MRIAPLAVWAANVEDLEQHREIILAETSVTHASAVAQDAAFVYAQAVAYLLNNTSDADRAHNAFEHALGLSQKFECGQITNWLQTARKKSDEQKKSAVKDWYNLKDLEVAGDESHVRHGFILAFYFLLRSSKLSYEAAIRQTI